MDNRINRPIDPFKNISYGSLEKEVKYQFSGNMQYPFNIEMLGITYPDADYFISRKMSDYFIIEYVFSGKGFLMVNGKEYPLVAGDVYILPPESTHSYRADPADPFQKIWCNFYSEIFAKVQRDYRLDNEYVFHAPECRDDFFRLTSIAQFGNTINDDAWHSVAEILFCILNKLAARYYRPEGQTALTAQAKEILDNSIYSNLTIEDLAKQLFVSKMLLSREFGKTYGISPYRYLLNKKISQAKLFLHNSDMTVKEISEKLCFSDEHYFSGLFKRKTGLSPIGFRKRLL